MAKKKAAISIRSYGIYSKWDSKSKLLPKITEFTTEIPAEIDIEFGLVVNIKSARGQKVYYCIDHPGIVDDSGRVRAPFTGEVKVTNNDWSFYIGDTIWAPIADKCGTWSMSIVLNGEVIACKNFSVIAENSEPSMKGRFGYM